MAILLLMGWGSKGSADEGVRRIEVVVQTDTFRLPATLTLPSPLATIAFAKAQKSAKTTSGAGSEKGVSASGIVSEKGMSASGIVSEEGVSALGIVSERGVSSRGNEFVKIPCVVMVHGSGPNDRDETVGPNKLFRDLADSLAAYGIASLRYEKRTRVYGAASLPAGRVLDYDVEVVDDACSALALAAAHEEIDPSQIYLLGHSLGALLAPRIAERYPSVAGAMMLAPPARKLPELMLGQGLYLKQLYGKMVGLPPMMMQQLENLVEQSRNALRWGTPQYDETIGLPKGLTPSYIEADRAYQPVVTACRIATPLLLIQGERDYQVTLVDYAQWCTGLMMRKNVTFRCYPKLNHLMREGEGMGTPMEYATASPLPSYVVQDIIAFVRK